MNNSFNEKTLIYKISLREKEIIDINKKVSELNSVIENLEQEKTLLNVKIGKLQNLEKNIKTLTEENEFLEREKRTLVQEVKQKDRIIKELKENNTKKIEEFIHKFKLHIESLNIKLDAATHLENLSSAQQDKILSLKKEIVDRNKEFECTLESKFIEFEEKKGELHRKIMDQIRILKINNENVKESQLGLSSTLNIMLNKQYSSELDYQSTLIEKLIEKNKNMENNIFEQKADLQIQKGINEVLKEKIKKLKHLVENRVVKKKDKEVSSDCSDYLETVFTQNSFKFKSRNTDKNMTTYSSTNLFTKSKSKLTLATPLDTVVKLEKKIKLLENELDKKKSEYEMTKLKFNILLENSDNLYKKFSNIINLFNEELHKLSEDKTIKRLNYNNLRLDHIKNAEFDSFSQEMKHYILTSLVNTLLPMIRKDSNNSESEKSNSTIKIKYRFLKNDDSKLRLNTSSNKTKYTFEFPRDRSKDKNALMKDKRFNSSKFTLF